MKTKLVFLFLMIFLSLSFAQGQQALSPHAYLRKLSLHIQGKDPTLEEHNLLDGALQTHSEDKFFMEKINEYLSTQSHVEKMDHRLSELFFLASPEEPSDLMTPKEKYAFKNNNALVALFREIISKNLSWDTLLTGKSYTLSSISSPQFLDIYTDYGFYSAVKKLDPSDVGIIKKFENYDNSSQDDNLTTTRITFDQNDPRIAGAITTPRFFERYTNTALNKDRRRSAAIFRIFMCNPLMPVVIPPDDTKTQSLIDLARGKLPSQGIPIQVDKRHGGDLQCNKCHSMLDPMGKTFQTSSLALAEDPAAGALFYKRFSGEQVNIPVKGLGELGQVITTEPEYSQCQVKHFWTWFIGEDILLSKDRLSELTVKFDSVNRKPNDFIAYLVTQPEFKAKRGVDAPDTALTFKTVKPTFDQCTACHRQAEVNVADFDRLPYEKDDRKMAYWVAAISQVLDLDHDGLKPTMPPSISQWRPSHDEIINIKKWIAARTPDENGVPSP